MGSEFQIKPQKASETAPGNVPRAWWPAHSARDTVAVCKKGGLKFLYSQIIFPISFILTMHIIICHV